ncbi:MAG TPA: hypothetical protein VKY32_03925 [Flavobacterium sp.]|nr:hypothetical protein [Flavobacterium sp.]
MKKWLALLSVIALCGCTAHTEHIPVSFYFWRTSFKLTSVEQQYLNELNVQKLYVRYFDVALKDTQAIPVSAVVFDHKPQNLEIVPVVYIKNEVFLQNAADSLSTKVYRYIQQINQSAGITVNEIQFDCDWSLKSKQNYFHFLDEFKKLHPNLSATIRLHQIKYPEKTGIPNVQNGVLMYYNMGVISSGENNSIYDRAVARRYIKSLQNYSLPLDVALPIFSWGVHIRQNQVTNLIGGLRATDLNSKQFKQIDENRYKVLEDLVYKGRFLAKNDEIKIEETSAKQLKEMIADLKKNMKNKPKEIILYDLNEQNLQQYEKEAFQTINHW